MILVATSPLRNLYENFLEKFKLVKKRQNNYTKQINFMARFFHFKGTVRQKGDGTSPAGLPSIKRIKELLPHTRVNWSGASACKMFEMRKKCNFLME